MASQFSFAFIRAQREKGGYTRLVVYLNGELQLFQTDVQYEDLRESRDELETTLGWFRRLMLGEDVGKVECSDGIDLREPNYGSMEALLVQPESVTLHTYPTGYISDNGLKIPMNMIDKVSLLETLEGLEIWLKEGEENE